MAYLSIHPECALLDEPVDIRVSGLIPNQPITISARISNSGMTFLSFAHYTASRQGEVDLHSDSSSGGTYDGVEPMGLFWSMKPTPGQSPGLRLIKRDVTTPYDVTMAVHWGHEDLMNAQTKPAITRTITRHFMTSDVQRIPINLGRLTGTLFIPNGTGPYPGVVDLFGTIGGIVEHRAALLASRGFAALALAYFWVDDERGIVTDMEYFENAVNYLASLPRVRSEGIGVIGVSKGADLALLMGTVIPKVRAVVFINGLPCPCGVDQTYRGETFPCVPYNVEKMKITDEGLVFRHLYEDFTEQHIIPVERAENCDFLLLSCEDDYNTIPVARDIIPARLRSHGKGSQCECVSYPGAGHLLEPPYTPHFRVTYHRMMAGLSVWGGTPREHARAQEAAWAKIQGFLSQRLCASDAQSPPQSDSNCQQIHLLPKDKTDFVSKL